MRRLIWGLAVVAIVLSAAPLRSQRVRLPAPAAVPGSAVAQPPGVTLGAPVTTPFDPYNVAPPLPTPALPSVPGTAPTFTNPTLPSPSVIQAPGTVNGSLVAPNAAGIPILSGPRYPSTAPPAMFPDGIFPNWDWTPGQWLGGGAITPPPYESLFQDFFMRHTWFHGETDPQELEMHETEAATSLVIPGPLGISKDIRLTPGFIFYTLEGPVVLAGSTHGDLPGRLYGGYLDSFLDPQITSQLSAELNARIGVYSDFDHLTDDSIRLTGRGIFLLRLTPSATLKGGVEFLDRLDIKLLPAGGVLWEPNPQTRFDIYFPRPKLAHYFRTIGASEIWWYVGAEYGGGSWTVREVAGENPFTGRIDINDFRGFVGLDFTRPSGFTGFIEGGYAFEREIIYDGNLGMTLDLEDTFMVRAGLIW